MALFQPGILMPIPRIARYLTFSTVRGADPRPALRALAAMADGASTVVGLGEPLVTALAGRVAGLRTMPALSGAGLEVPSTPAALWCWLRGEAHGGEGGNNCESGNGDDDGGTLLHRTRAIEKLLAGAFELRDTLDAFRHGSGRDLTGYEDGTENPTGTAATDAAFLSGAGRGLDGSSFVAVQRWAHDFGLFDAMSATEKDHMIGRRRSDNEELDDAPESAHVKRTAQESFDPEAFVLRRSMPFSAGAAAGLEFVAFGKSFDAFEAQMRRMVGADDGITDALFKMSRPVTGSYFWCPPLQGGRLDLSALGL